MAKEATSGGNKTFLNINKDGYFYIKSNEPKEGYEEITLKEGGKTYHKLFKETDDGVVDYIAIEERNFPSGKVKLVSIAIDSGDGIDKVSFQLFKNKGGLSDYAKGLAVVLPNLDYNRKVNIAASKKRNDRDFLNQFLFFNYIDGEEPKYPSPAHRYGKEGDIPSGVKTEVMGAVKWDFSAQDDYLYKILESEIERFKVIKGEKVAEAPKVKEAVEEPTKNPEPATASVATDEEPDDLPF